MSQTSNKAPIAVELQPGKYAWCACGKSQKQPFCDGSHKGSGMSPQLFEITEAKKYFMCNCKHTHNAPFCDGTHNKI